MVAAWGSPRCWPPRPWTLTTAHGPETASRCDHQGPCPARSSQTREAEGNQNSQGNRARNSCVMLASKRPHWCFSPLPSQRQTESAAWSCNQQLLHWQWFWRRQWRTPAQRGWLRPRWCQTHACCTPCSCCHPNPEPRTAHRQKTHATLAVLPSMHPIGLLVQHPSSVVNGWQRQSERWQAVQ